MLNQHKIFDQINDNSGYLKFNIPSYVWEEIKCYDQIEVNVGATVDSLEIDIWFELVDGEKIIKLMPMQTLGPNLNYQAISNAPRNYVFI